MFIQTATNARIIVVALLPLMTLSNCNGGVGEAEFWEGERAIIELAQQLKLNQYRLSLFDSGKAAELVRLKDLTAANEARLKALEAEKSALTGEIAKLQARNNELSRSAREDQRSRSQGIKFSTFATTDGRTFKNVIVSAVDDSGVAIRHEHGAATLRYADLADEQRRFFGLEESVALAAENRERSEALAYEQSITSELEMMRQHDDENLAEVSQNSIGPQASLFRPQAETRALAQPARAFGTGSIYRRWYNYSDYRSYRPVYRYVSSFPVARPYCPPTSGSSGGARQYRAPGMSPCPPPFTTHD